MYESLPHPHSFQLNFGEAIAVDSAKTLDVISLASGHPRDT